MSKFPWAGLIGFIVIIGLAFTLFQIGDLGLGQAGTEDLNQQNETLVVTFTNDVHVSRSPEFDRYTQGFLDNETLWNSSGAELTEGTDYEWNTTDGGVTFINTANLTDSENVNISYTYEYNVETVRESEPVNRVIIESIPLWVLIPFILFIGGLFVWGWRLIKGATSSNSRQTFGGR